MEFKDIAEAARTGNSLPENQEDLNRGSNLGESIKGFEEVPSAKTAESADAKPVVEEKKAVEEKAKVEPAPATPDSRVVELEAKLAAAEKRTRDNQAAYHTAHQEELRLKKENELLKAGKPVIPGEESEWFETDDKDKSKPEEKKTVQPDPEIAVIKQEIADLKQQEWQSKWDAAEKPVREKFDDYGKIVDEFLAPEFETNPELQKRFQEKGGTPEAAYELGKELYFIRNPEEYRAHILAEEAAKTKIEDEDKSEAIRQALSATSKKPGDADVVRSGVSREQGLINGLFK